MPTLELVAWHSRDLPYVPKAFNSYHFQSTGDIDMAERISIKIDSDVLSGRVVAMTLFNQILLSHEWEVIENLEPQLNALVRMMDTRLQKNDSVDIEYSHQHGSEVFVKGEYMGTLPGSDLFNAIVTIWGEQPPTTTRLTGIM